MINKIKAMLWNARKLWNARSYKSILRLAINELEFLDRQLEYQREDADRIRSLTEKFCKESELDMTSGEHWELEEVERGAEYIQHDIKWLKDDLRFVINLLKDLM